MKLILVIEDEITVQGNIVQLLEVENFDTIVASNGEQGIKLAQAKSPDLIICDISMPKMDGYEVLKTLRQQTDTATIPFIFLTAKAELSDMRQGMGVGADDYLTKPFTAKELLNAIQLRLQKQEMLVERLSNELKKSETNNPTALTSLDILELQQLASSLDTISQKLRVVAPGSTTIETNQTKQAVNSQADNIPSSSDKFFKHESLQIDFVKRQVTVNGQEIEFTHHQYELLIYLVKNRGRVITHKAALNHVWGSEYEYETQYLHVFINKLRQKIEPNPAHPRYIITERGVGYRFHKS